MPIIQRTDEGITFDAEHLHNAMPAINASLEKMKSYEEKFLDLCEDSKLDELKKMYYGTSLYTKVKGYYKLHKKEVIGKLINRCFIEAQFEVFKWVETLGYDIEMESFLFYNVLNKGNFEMAKYLYEKDHNIINDNNRINDHIMSRMLHASTELVRILALASMEQKQNYEGMKWFADVANYNLVFENNKYSLKENNISNMVIRNKIQKTKVDDYKECPICLDESKANIRLECGHEYCNECLDKMPYNNNCSVCRKEVNYDNSLELVK
jgi:hypothetical protein